MSRGTANAHPKSFSFNLCRRFGRSRMQCMHILVTGAAGFIGYHLSERLLARGDSVTGLDNLNAYYPVALKRARLERLQAHGKFHFLQADLADREALEALFSANKFDAVVNLAAQAGVRYSLENPRAYVDSNIVGFGNILECCRHHAIGHLVYASSSSVYGMHTHMPFSVHDNVDHPVSLYAAIKKANELMAHSYSHLFGLPTTGLRFFTVYGPCGRPDMALFLFTRAILADEPIQVFNQGNMLRDFTYVDDIVEGIVASMNRIPSPDPEWNGKSPDPGTSYVPWRVYNIGNNKPVKLMDFIHTLEKLIGKQAEKEYLPMQPGDVPETFADIDDLIMELGYRPDTPLEEGLRQFVAWYRDYYKV